MKKLLLWGLMGLGAAILISGCASPGEPVETDRDAMIEMIGADPLFTSDRNLLNDENPINFAKTVTPIYPRGWGRRITSVSRSITFDQVTDTLAIVTVEHKLIGEVKIAAKYSPSDTVIAIISKPDTEITTRKIKFYRIARTSRPRDNWRPRELSAVKGGTTNSILEINQMMVYVGGDTLVITDPNEYFLRLPSFVGRQLPSINTGTPITVQVTLTSTESDTDMVFLHRPFMWLNGSIRPAHARMTMISQTGTGPYTRTYEISWSSQIQGRHHFFVSAITRNSLFDDVAPWATRLWGVPYIVQ